MDIFYKIQLSFMLMGVMGNFISFVIYSRKSFARNSINVYCRALAISNSLVILLQIPNCIALLFYSIDLYTTSDSICKFSVYASTVLPSNSSWILVVFALDKLVCVMFPSRYKLRPNMTN